ncbi:Dna2/Cas4 domain-containing protein [bacterium]|nr:Dna2/Cas4 domain-containing protein [bacterium]
MPDTQYIPLDTPCLARLAGMLVERHADGRLLDLSAVIVILPGRRAGRRLLELLCERAAAERLVLSPPEMVTMSVFCARLAGGAAGGPAATTIEQLAAWAEALRAAPGDVLEYFSPRGETATAADTFSVAQMLAALHRELSGERIAPRTLAGMPFEDEAEALRWHAFDSLRGAYLGALAAHGLVDPYDAVERALGSTGATPLPGTRAVYAAGIVDAHAQFRAALDAVADRLAVVCHGPAEWFDDHGMLLPGSPLDTSVSTLDDAHVHIADNPPDQARAALRALASLGGAYGHADITIAVPDYAVMRPLQQSLRAHGVACHDATGAPFSQTELGRLLSCFSAMIETRSYDSFLAFLRHPLAARWANDAGDEAYAQLLLDASAYAAGHVVDMIDEEWRAPEGRFAHLRAVIGRVRALCAPYCAARPLAGWPAVFNQTLSELFAAELPGNDIPSARQHMQAIRLWCALVEETRAARIQFADQVHAATALRWFTSLLRDADAPTDSDGAAIDLVGWLELALDDAPAVIVTGMNERVVPGPGTSDPFLPNSLRAQLGLQNDARRLRRDRYLLRALEQGTAALTLICGRRSAQNDPLRPSRLLFDVPDERKAAMVARFFGRRDAAPGAAGQSAPPRAPAAARQPAASFAPPEPGTLPAPPDRVSVTALASYLSCPYQFYLARLRVEEPPEPAGELDALQFGTLAHDALAAWARSPAAAAADADPIIARAVSALERLANERFGEKPHPAVALQIAACRNRLIAFAHCQAREAHDGWRIDPALIEAKMELPLVVNNVTIVISGRIDRVDRRGAEARILDYKTSATAKPPEKAHRKSGEWIDLQLPLYARWFQGDNAALPSTGYFNLPESPEQTGVAMAEWTDEDIGSAVAAAEAALAAILDNDFHRTDDRRICAVCPYVNICQRW